VNVIVNLRDSIKCMEVLEEPSDRRLLKKDSARWSLLVICLFLSYSIQ
jgi:hypothetical protein